MKSPKQASPVKKANTAKAARESALICRGLTGNQSIPSSIDDLKRNLDSIGWLSHDFDYRFRLNPTKRQRLRTTQSMVRDVSGEVRAWLNNQGRLPDVIIARGTGARVALEALVHYPKIPLVMWAPLLWLRTSLELRYRLHEIRRTGRATFDNTTIGDKFVASLKSPTDREIKGWIKPQRRHIIIQAKDDKVNPMRLAEEAYDLIKAAKGDVQLIVVEGNRPHPGVDVRDQINKIVQIVSGLT